MSAKKSQTTKAKTTQTKAEPVDGPRGHRVIDHKIAAERALGSSRRPPAIR